jgi:hypothetical protein
MISKVINSNLYEQEMKWMIDTAIEKLKKEHPGFIIYTASIWTDAEAGASAISFDSEEHSEYAIDRSFQSLKQLYESNKDFFDQRFGTEYVQLLLSKGTRNENPADFKLRDYVEISNTSIDTHLWRNNDERLWQELTSQLHKIAEYALTKLKTVPLHKNFILGINGSKDWFEFTWSINTE